MVNAKTQRPSVCNAAEKLLVHKDVAGKVLPPVLKALEDKGVELIGSSIAKDIRKTAIPTRCFGLIFILYHLINPS